MCMHMYKKLNQWRNSPNGGAKAYGANIRLPDRGRWGAKHMSRLGGQSKAGPPVFSSQACLVLSLSTH